MEVTPPEPISNFIATPDPVIAPRTRHSDGMSYDIAIFPATEVTSVRQARARHQAMTESYVGTPDPIIERVLDELEQRLPGADGTAPSESGADARGAVVFTWWFTAADNLYTVLDLTKDYSLAVFDPQTGRMYDPRGQVPVDVRCGDGSRLPYLTETILAKQLRILQAPHPFLIVERSDQDFIQTYLHDDGSFDVEYRAGSAAQHFQATAADWVVVQAVIWAWATQKPLWREALSWARMDVASFADEPTAVRAEDPLAPDTAQLLADIDNTRALLADLQTTRASLADIHVDSIEFDTIETSAEFVAVADPADSLSFLTRPGVVVRELGALSVPSGRLSVRELHPAVSGRVDLEVGRAELRVQLVEDPAGERHVGLIVSTVAAATAEFLDAGPMTKVVAAPVPTVLCDGARTPVGTNTESVATQLLPAQLTVATFFGVHGIVAARDGGGAIVGLYVQVCATAS